MKSFFINYNIKFSLTDVIDKIIFTIFFGIAVHISGSYIFYNLTQTKSKLYITNSNSYSAGITIIDIKIENDGDIPLYGLNGEIQFLNDFTYSVDSNQYSQFLFKNKNRLLIHLPQEIEFQPKGNIIIRTLSKSFNEIIDNTNLSQNFVAERISKQLITGIENTDTNEYLIIKSKSYLRIVWILSVVIIVLILMILLKPILKKRIRINVDKKEIFE